jgi:hypothetical protein
VHLTANRLTRRDRLHLLSIQRAAHARFGNEKNGGERVTCRVLWGALLNPVALASCYHHLGGAGALDKSSVTVSVEALSLKQFKSCRGVGYQIWSLDAQAIRSRQS